MTRTFAIAAILSLTALSTQAETLSEQVHTAAVKACAVDEVQSRPVFFYSTLTKNCVDHVTAVTLHKLAERARTQTLASTASLAN